MAEKHQVHHRGYTVNIRRVTAVKNGSRIADGRFVIIRLANLYGTSGPRWRKPKPRQGRSASVWPKASARYEYWDEQQRFSIRQALRLLEPTQTTIDRACAIFAEAAKIIPAEEIVAACRAWHDKRPNRRLVPKRVSEAVPEFLKRRVEKVSARRYRTDDSDLGMFQRQFANRLLHEVSTLEIKDWADAKRWMPKTKNDALGLVRLMYADAIDRGYAVENPAKSIKRESVGTSDVGIFTPGQVQRILNAVEDRMKPFFSLIFFSGVRKEECSRLSTAQVHEGLKSGAVFLPALIAKTNRSRSIPIRDNLKAWLTRYLPLDGPVLPTEWQCMERLDELGAYAARRAGLDWVYNGPRHSFATYALRLTGDPGQVVKEMGNSLAQLDRHYYSRADSVTSEAAKQYFAIMPSVSAEVVPLSTARAA